MVLVNPDGKDLSGRPRGVAQACQLCLRLTGRPDVSEIRSGLAQQSQRLQLFRPRLDVKRRVRGGRRAC